jgi:hypothetical protein
MPSRFRCLRGVLIALVCASGAWILSALDAQFCGGLKRLAVPCEDNAAEVLALMLWICACVGVAWSIYRAYRDFVRGDYRWDMKRSGHL